MFAIKLSFFSILLLYISTVDLKAQEFFKPEITCNEAFRFDSALFFSEIQPDLTDIADSIRNADLFGPYFDQFPQIRSDIISALSYYPELAHLHLRFSYKPIRQTMNSRPSPINVFKKKANRRYTIIVNNNLGKHKGLPFEELSFNIKVGWLGHELAHTCEYETMNTGKTLLFSLKYICSKKFVRKVERYTDFLTIKHGLAFPLYDGVDYLLESKDIDEKYSEQIIFNSLSLEEIKCLWSEINTENASKTPGESAKVNR
jgi:hypothetical protein